MEETLINCEVGGNILCLHFKMLNHANRYKIPNE